MTRSNSTESSLDRYVREKWAALQAERVTNFGDLPLFDYVTSVSPRFTRPEHLSAVVPVMEAIHTAPQFLAFSAPPRHGKSQLVFHFIARFIAKYPHLNVAYASYSATFAERKSVEIRELVRRSGVEMDNTSKARGTWRTAAGGSFLARGPGGPLTGEGVHLLVCDDPYRDRKEAESATIRENVYDWWTSVAMTRLEPGASVVVTHTRWHPEDLIGRLLEDQDDFVHYNIPAIGEEGDALWPERFDLDALQQRRKQVGEYDWASMYMGEPRPRGAGVFQGTYLYTLEVPREEGPWTTEPWRQKEKEKFPSLPATKFKKLAIGIDCAYSKKTHADYSVAVVIGIDNDDNVWVLDVVRKQCEASEFALILKQLRLKHGSPPIYWYLGGIEKPVLELFQAKGVPVKGVPAKEDKFVRAQAVAAHWNAGKVWLPKEPLPWVNSFLTEVLAFTGLDDRHDDCVDALAAAFIPLAGKKVMRGMLNTRLLSF